MESVARLVDGISHHINNQLVGIIGNLDFAEEESPNKVTDYLSNVRNSADRITDLVRQLMKFSQRTSIALQMADLNRIIGEVVNLARNTIDPRINIVAIPIQTFPKLLSIEARSKPSL